MDMPSATTIATMPEMVVITNGSSSNNKRKRRSSTDEKDIENQRPPLKKIYSPSDDGSLQRNQTSRSNSSNNNNNISNMNNNNSNNNTHNLINGSSDGRTVNETDDTTVTATDGSAEMTPQNLIKKSEIWNSCIKCCTNQTSEFRLCPLPVLSWADAKEVWKFMCKKDEQAALDRDSKMLHYHPGLQPRMRAILLDWLIEVCEVYKLHRETYYLALDYLDRYLSTNVSISKTYLQLIGITCLFIAAKVEEIYPPKLSDFAYVTDGACREEDILKQELIILMALKWQISPVTIIGWLSIYMQLNVNKRISKTKSMKSSQNDETNASQNDEKVAATPDDAFVFPQFSGMEYAQTAQLIDLCTLDVGIANYSYSVIAAAAISHTFNKKTAIKLSGLDWATISPCSRWMEPFFRICVQSPKLCLLETNEQVETKYGLGHVCPNITTDDSHIIQVHTTNMDMFDEAVLCKEQIQQEASPAPPRSTIEHTCPPDGLLTPPASNRKYIETQPPSTCK